MRKLSKEAREAMRQGGRNGGLARVPKGFATMEKTRHIEVATKGAHNAIQSRKLKETENVQKN